MAQISIKIFEEADLEVFLRMTKSEYGASVSSDAAHIRWKHLDSPFGASSYIKLTEADRIVGRVLLQPRPLYIDGNVLRVATVTDLLIDRQHRSTPINFINITKACGNVTNTDLIYHTSNERTFPLYSKLFRYPNPFSLKAYGFPVRFSGLLSLLVGRRIELMDWLVAPFRWFLVGIYNFANCLSRIDITRRPMNDDELTALSSKCLIQSAPHLERNNAFLKWRFDAAPSWAANTYRVDRNGRFLGYVVTRDVELNGLNHFVLMDFMLDTDVPYFVRFTLRMWLIRKAISSKADALFTMVNAFSSMAGICTSFPLINIPDKLLPHSTPIFVRSLNPYNEVLVKDGTIHFTLGDLDYF